MAKIVDARGLPCPQPVLKTRAAMNEAEEVITLVSGRDQVANVQRLAEKAGWQVTVESREDGFAIHLRKGQIVSAPEVTPEMTACDAAAPTVVVISGEQMGRGPEELGLILIRAFFHTLTETEPLPKTLVFYNTGIKWTVEGSPVLDDLRALEQKGVEILVCGTCLGYFNLKERLAVGTISNMYTIVETLLRAGHVVSI